MRTSESMVMCCRRGPDKGEKLRMQYNSPTKKWTIPFIMAPINTRVVRRSNALLHHSYGEFAHAAMPIDNRVRHNVHS